MTQAAWLASAIVLNNAIRLYGGLQKMTWLGNVSCGGPLSISLVNSLHFALFCVAAASNVKPNSASSALNSQSGVSYSSLCAVWVIMPLFIIRPSGKGVDGAAVVADVGAHVHPQFTGIAKGEQAPI